MKKIYLSAILALFILQYNNSQTANDTIAIQDLDEVVVSTPFKETVKNNVINFIDEIVIYSSNTDELVKEIKTRYPNRQIIVYPDPACRQRKTSAGGMTDLNILQNAGLTVRVKNAHPQIRDRINAVNSRLKNTNDQRMMFIDPKCKNIIRGLERHLYKEGTTQPDKDSGFDHMNDAIGYAVDYLFPIRKQYTKQLPQRWSVK
jgi:hypothetical protein